MESSGDAKVVDVFIAVLMSLEVDNGNAAYEYWVGMVGGFSHIPLLSMWLKFTGWNRQTTIWKLALTSFAAKWFLYMLQILELKCPAPACCARSIPVNLCNCLILTVSDGSKMEHYNSSQELRNNNYNEITMKLQCFNVRPTAVAPTAFRAATGGRLSQSSFE